MACMSVINRCRMPIREQRSASSPRRPYGLWRDLPISSEWQHEPQDCISPQYVLELCNISASASRGDGSAVRLLAAQFKIVPVPGVVLANRPTDCWAKP